MACLNKPKLIMGKRIEAAAIPYSSLFILFFKYLCINLLGFCYLKQEL